MRLSGVIPPLVTPFGPDESLDLTRLRWLIDYLIGKRAPAVFVLGTTGEFYALDEAEKQAVVAATVEHVAGRVPVIVGTGAESTREVVRLSHMAEKEKADALSVITPYFLKPTQAELADHYRRVAEAVALPVILYSNPGTCGGVNIEPDTCATLAEVPNVIGVKDSSGDLQQIIDILRAVPRDRFAVLNGRDTLIFAALAVGADGAIAASCNVAPDLCAGIYESFVRGDLETARALQLRLHALRMAFPLVTGSGAVKEAMALLGRPVGPCRRPVSPMTPERREKLRKILAEAGITE